MKQLIIILILLLSIQLQAQINPDPVVEAKTNQTRRQQVELSEEQLDEFRNIQAYQIQLEIDYQEIRAILNTQMDTFLTSIMKEAKIDWPALVKFNKEKKSLLFTEIKKMKL